MNTQDRRDHVGVCSGAISPSAGHGTAAAYGGEQCFPQKEGEEWEQRLFLPPAGKQFK